LVRSVFARGLAAAALVAVVLVTGATSASGRPSKNICGPYPFSDPSTHWEAVFGHRTSTAEANVLRRQLVAKAFKGIEFEKVHCDDIELEIPGFDTPAERKAFADEADASNVPVSFEPPDNQKPNGPGEMTAVFGHLPTLKRASDLQGQIAVKGWRENNIVRAALHDWKVVVYHIPVKIESDFAAEAKGAGYSVTFEG
jgi:hypothetical protein